jgi:uncharacterized protein (DUF1810 family)/ankyrin repeat protein
MTYDLERFVGPQSAIYDQVLTELRQGRKQTHWIWFVFPQLAGLGSSPTAQHFAISGAEEARAYLRHPVLGPRLRECTATVNAVEGRSVDQIFGAPDNLKFRSSVTLFASLATDNTVFTSALHKYFAGVPDPATQRLLYAADPLQRDFESAADAIINGDLPALQEALARHPELIRTRSIREHRSTLLHYVAANGVEGERQKTPQNILEITSLLLDAGAEINAESEAYGGHSTTLMLAATSCHPEDAGLQIPLLRLLLARGAAIDVPPGASIVNACLHNGRGLAAAFLADNGASLDIEGAAGVGRLDLVRSLPKATESQRLDAFAWACQFGHAKVVAHFLEHGVPVDAKLRHHGNTGLHWAAWGAHADVVRLLLQNGVSVNTRDEHFNGTPLEWALYAWATASASKPWHHVVALLVRAGATHDPQWFHAGRQGAADKLRASSEMQAALRGELLDEPLTGQ